MVRMGRFGEVRERFSSADGAKLAKFDASSTQMRLDSDVTYQEAIMNRRLRF